MSSYVNFLRGSYKAYKRLPRKDPDTFYFVKDDSSDVSYLYIGEELIGSSSTAEEQSLAALQDVVLERSATGDVLVYNSLLKIWENKNIKDIITIMTGASSLKDGTSGLVPTPKAGEQDYFLRGDGSWQPVESFKEVQAEDIIGLSSWITNNQDNINGLYPASDSLKLSKIEDEAQVNIIDKVSSDFTIVEGKILQLNTLTPSKIEGLTQAIEKIDVLQTQVNKLVENSQEIADLKSTVDQLSLEKIPKIETKIENLDKILNDEKYEIQSIKQELIELPNKYISKIDFNTVVGDLNSLLLNNINISSEIDDINNRLKWKEI